MSGTLSILNCTTGDTKISFDPSNPEEVERGKRIVTEMLRAGYILAVNVEGRMRRAKTFDPERCEYIVQHEPNTEMSDDVAPRKRGRPRGSGARVPAASTDVVAVGRTAGGALGVRSFAPDFARLRKAQA